MNSVVALEGRLDISRRPHHRNRIDNTFPSPGGATDRSHVCRPSGAGKHLSTLPVAPPPANIRRPSGTEEISGFKSQRTSGETSNFSIPLLFPFFLRLDDV